MCGRDFLTFTEEQLYFRYLSNTSYPWPVFDKIPAFKPNYNMCPTQSTPVLCVEDNTLKFIEMRWGLVPAWAKTVKDADKYSMINAKSEEISAKRSYKKPFERQRCIIPLSGFFEWKRNDKVKVPFAIKLKNEEIMSVGGIWEKWKGDNADIPLYSFSIITMPANSFMNKIHDRMPLILNRKEETSWIDPNINNEKDLRPLMCGCKPEDLECFEVSKAVNSPKNNSPENLIPLSL